LQAQGTILFGVDCGSEVRQRRTRSQVDQHFAGNRRPPAVVLGLASAKNKALRANRLRVHRPRRREKYREKRQKTKWLHGDFIGGGNEKDNTAAIQSRPITGFSRDESVNTWLVRITREGGG
jgi:hypothetical protein